MATTLSLLCDRIIEAGWLVVLIVTPLFFNVHSHRTFEPDKLTILHTIALLMALAWMIKGLERWGAREQAAGQPRYRTQYLSLWREVVAYPLPCLGLLWLIVSAFATVTSVAPRQSLWGSYERLQGLYTTSAYVVIFISIVALLRRREQVERLLTTVLVVSLPVSLYGILQHFGTDPVPWEGDASRRVTSTMGNPIFVAAFVIMTVPPTLYRHLEAGWRIAEHESGGIKLILIIGSLLQVLLQIVAWWLGPTTGSLAAVTTVGIWIVEAFLLGKPLLPFLRIGSYSVLLSAQLTCLLLSQSRGPWLGLIAGVFCFALLWTLVRGKWQWTGLIAGGGVAVLLLLAVMNLPKAPLPFVRDLPYVDRLNQMLDSHTSRVRLLIWQGAVPLITAEPLRLVIGYGPETLPLVYPPYYPPELGRVEQCDALPDRAHNETFDLLVTTGLFGCAVYLSFLTSLFVWGLQHLGLLRTPLQRHVFLGLWGIGGVGAVGLSYLIDHSGRLFGLTLPLGMLGGFLVYLSGYGLHGLLRGRQSSADPMELSQHLLGATLLAAIVAHSIEIQVGIAIAATRTYFWTYAALLVGAWQIEHRHSAVASATVPAQSVPRSASTAGNQPRHSGRRRQRLPATPTLPAESSYWLRHRQLVAGSILTSCILLTMVYDFLSVPMTLAHLPGIVWLFTFTWALGGLMLVTETWTVNGATSQRAYGLSAGGIYAGITLLVTLLFTAVYQGPIRLWSTPDGAPVLYTIMVFLVLVAIGGALLLGEPRPGRMLTGIGGIVAPGLAVGTLFLVMSNLTVVRADIFYKQARAAAHQQDKYDHAIALYRRALELQPRQDAYHLFLGRTLLEYGQRSQHPEERERLLLEAAKSLRTARDLNPLKIDNTANLARLYHIWAQHTDDPAQRTTHLQTALTFYAQATTQSPSNVLLWNEWGTTYFFMADLTQAREKYQHALALDDTFAPTYLHLGDLERVQSNWQEAAQAYEQVVIRNPYSLHGHSALGEAYVKLGRLTDAIRANQHVLELAPHDLASHRNLAFLFQSLGRVSQALVHAHRALQLAPPQERAAIEQLIAQLRQQ